MSVHKTPESQKLLKLIEEAPFTEDEKTKWQSAIEENGITPELAEEVHNTLNGMPADKFTNDWQKAGFSMELSALLKQWRMSQGSKNFKHNR